MRWPWQARERMLTETECDAHYANVLAIQEGWLTEQKEAILDLARRLGLAEAEARSYGQWGDTTEELRRMISEYVTEHADPTVPGDASKILAAVNVLASRVAAGGE